MKKLFSLFMLALIPISSPPLRAEEKSDAVSFAKSLEAERKEWINKIFPAFVDIGGGSGVCISEDGLVLTNHHVAGALPEWSVNMPVGQKDTEFKRYKAKVLGKDPFGDVCLLQLDLKEGEKVPYVKLGDSDALNPGDSVVSLGDPYKLAAGGRARPTVTSGVVSAIHVSRANYRDAIQTDSSVNPGNSGGPLFNEKGEMIGINGQVLVRWGDRKNTGAAYAIPSNQLKRFMSALKTANGQNVSHAEIDGLGIENLGVSGEGVKVSVVRAGTTAEKAGLKVGDIIEKVEEYKAENTTRFYGIIHNYPSGDSIKLHIKNRETAVEVKLDPFRMPGGPNPQSGYLGIKIDTEFEGPGVKISEVTKGFAAESAGLQIGDILLEMNDKKIQTSDAFMDMMGKTRAKQKVKFLVKRGEGKAFEKEVELGKRPKNN